MSKQDKYLKPNGKGLLVRDPISMTPLSEAGEYKPWSGGAEAKYWRRRVKDGSVTICDPPAKQNPEQRESKFKKTEDKS